MAAQNKSALGRGLGAIIADAKEIQENSGVINFKEVDIEKIQANPYQPRTTFEQGALEELSNSIKKLGIIQPITLRRSSGDHYQIISGERRFRASKLAGLTVIPAYLREAGDEELLEMALVENIQRENLDPIEVAFSYQRLIEEFSLTQEQVSERVGKNRSTVTNMIRLLKLPASVQLLLQTNAIQTGHARALLALNDDKEKEMLAEQIVKYDFSVRKVEEIVKDLNTGENTELQKGKTIVRTPKEFKELKSALSQVFESKVSIACTPKGDGKITINFTSDNELERILAIFDKINS
ncbi:MAG: ParB/RepB/Spo0J family partition protein [Bacteroidales bacterium]|jgi:ParB family chromosome partitioning protein|nr:ParB/RepB/Spo0J family partition protein [Bacteroidales bacterium]